MDEIHTHTHYDPAANRLQQRRNVLINSEPNIPLKDIVPILQKLEERGYKFSFFSGT